MPRRVVRSDGPGRRRASGESTLGGRDARGPRSTRTATSSRCCSASRRSSATCPSRWSTRSPPQPACRVAHLRRHHLLRAVLHRAQRPAQGLRLPRHGLSRGRRHAPHRGARAGAGRRRRRDDRRLEFTLELGGLHGRLLAGARDAHRRRDLRQAQRRRDAQGDPRAACRITASSHAARPAAVGEGGERRCLTPRPASGAAEGVKVAVRARGRRDAGQGLRRHRLCVRRLAEGPRRLRSARSRRPVSQTRSRSRIIGCHGLCSQGPLAVVSATATTYYPRLKVKDVDTRRRASTSPAARSSRTSSTWIPRPASGSPAPHDIPFYAADAHRPARRAASSTRETSRRTWRAAATRPRARRSPT